MASKKKEKKEPVKQTATAETTTAPSSAPPGTPSGSSDLSISDLRNISTIIDVASTRGAFRANEMATVGVMFNKLAAFLAKIAPEQKSESTQPAETVANQTAPAKK